MKKNLNIGMIGYGFMGKAHSNAYATVSHFFELEHRPVLKAICGRNAEAAQKFADNWGYESIETDWRKLIARDDIDAIDICVPNHLHKEISIAAAKAGKMILCEKPIAMNAAEGEEMCEAVERPASPTWSGTTIAAFPAVTLAKTHHRRVENWAGFIITAPISCKTGRSLKTCRRAEPDSGGWMRREAGSGVTGDLLAHCIDTAIWLNGGIKDVTAMTETFVKERMHTETGTVQDVEHRRRLCVSVPLR